MSFWSSRHNDTGPYYDSSHYHASGFINYLPAIVDKLPRDPIESFFL
jgi:hypothetical protein